MKHQWIQRVGALGLVFFSFFLESCSNTGVTEDPYIDPHIIFPLEDGGIMIFL